VNQKFVQRLEIEDWTQAPVLFGDQKEDAVEAWTFGIYYFYSVFL
jgi:hypothetical protein